MNRYVIFILTVILATTLACSPAPAATPVPTAVPPPTQAPSEPTPPRTGRMRVEMQTSPYVHDLPWIIACETLEDMGYTLERIDLEQTELFIAALDKGDLDMAWLNTQATYTAIGQGAKIVEFMDRSANLNLVVTKASIATCADLHNRTIAVPGLTSPSVTLLTTYIARTCPGTEPQFALISGKRNRSAALLTGNVDGITDELDGMLQLELERPGEFHALITLASEFPDVLLNVGVVRRGFAEENPQAMRDMAQAIMLGRRRLRDQEALSQAMVHYLEYPRERADAAAAAYLALGCFDYEGRYNLERVQSTLSLMQSSGTVAASLKASDVADLSYYQAALAELDGR